MMSVKEYAKELNITVAEILTKCDELGINITNANDELSEDDIIILDHAMSLISTDEETTNEEKEVIASKIEEIIETTDLGKFETDEESQPKKNIKKKETLKKDNYKIQRKEMYKNKEKLQTNTQIDENVVLYKEGMILAEFADALQQKPTDVIKKLMELGIILTLNQSIDFETAEILALDYNKKLKKEETSDISNFEEFEIIDEEKDLVKRPPVITIMGHVDHGKTSLLDYLRSSNVTLGEAGGITQHIGAYQIEHKGEKLTFIDTPGHSAFTEMRARGASVTDIVIIIVAADDGVMPQTKEAIDHALSAEVPIVVAINKIDKPDANIERILTAMTEVGITPEEWGGDIPFVKISAKTGEGIDSLLETLLVTAEMGTLKANPSRYASGSVIESKIDKKVGGVASLLIQSGTLRIGDPLVVGTSYAKVRTMKNDLGEEIVEAGPSTPVEITGLNGNPSAGDKFMAFESEAQAKEVAIKRSEQSKVIKLNKQAVSFDDLFNQIQKGSKEINVVLKADVRGSEEAVRVALEKLEFEDIKIKIIRSGIGAITESDIVLANASNAIVLGFNVVPSNITKEVAREYNVEIRLYTVIYKLVEEMELAIKGLLDPEYEEKITGTAEVRKLYKFSKVGIIAGSHVIEGVVKNSSSIRIIRDNKVIYDGKISTIQREKDTVKEVKKGLDCGITVENYNDIKENDLIEAYEMVEIKHE